MALEHKVIKNKKVDKEKELNLKVSEDIRGERLYVEFTAEIPRSLPLGSIEPAPMLKLKVHKSFQNTFFGKASADDFIKSMKSVNDLKKYLKIA